METLTFLFTTTFYPPFHIGGDAVHVKYLSEELVKRGHEVHVLHSIDAYNVKRKSLPVQTETNGVYTHPIKTPFNYSSYAAYFTGNSSAANNKFEKLVKQVKPDVVHHHNISLLGYNLLKKRGHYRNLYTAHDYWLICQQNNLLRGDSKICGNKGCLTCTLTSKKPLQFWRNFGGFKNAIKDVDILITPSKYVGEKISAALSVKIFTLPNFVPEPDSFIEPSVYANFFLFAGALERHKGIISLIETYKQISQDTNARLLVAGDGSLCNKMRLFIDKNDLGNKIIPLGRIDNKRFLYSLLKHANGLIVPSICSENCPLIALEAISLGTPIVASNVGGLPEIVQENKVGLIYSSLPNLKKILTSDLHLKFSKSYIESIYKRQYSPDAFLEKYFDLLKV